MVYLHWLPCLPQNQPLSHPTTNKTTNAVYTCIINAIISSFALKPRISFAEIQQDKILKFAPKWTFYLAHCVMLLNSAAWRYAA